MTTNQTRLMTGLGHIAVNSADLDRFRRFYEGLLGMPLGQIMRMTEPPYLRHAIFAVDDLLFLHVFEVPGYDPQAQGIGIDIGQRGRIDHFGFIVRDEPTLRDIAARLRTAGATDGEIRSFGPILSLHVTDPDGLQLEITCPDPTFELDDASEDVEEIGRRDWFDRMLAAVTSRSGA